MKFKWKALIAAGVMVCSVAAFAGCASNDAGGTGDGGKEEDYGTLTIADSKVYITEGRDYTFAEIQPVFSKPDKAETLSYTYDDTDIKIENGIVTPLKRADKEVNVRAKSEHFNELRLAGWLAIKPYRSTRSLNVYKCFACIPVYHLWLSCLGS